MAGNDSMKDDDSMGTKKNVNKGTGIDWFEIRRKIFHILLGISLVFLISYSLINWFIVLLIFLLGIVVSISSKYVDLPFIDPLLKIFDRPEHKKFLPGKSVILLFLAILILMIFFDTKIICASILIWAFGDSFSAIVGKHYGRIRHPLNNDRLIEGTLAGIFMATIVSMYYVGLFAAFIASLVSMSIESLELKFLKHPLDDNFLVPIIAAIVLVLINSF